MSALTKHLKMPAKGKVYRVVQWGTGRIGKTSLKELIRSPEMDLVGVYVHSQDKDGKDAGDLCGVPPVGVTATRDIGEILRLRPDCVLAMQDPCNLDDLCGMLEAGINVSTCRVDFLDPERMDADMRDRIEEACRRGNATLHGTGASPSFSSEALPLAMVSMSRNMECMTIDEFADIPASCPDVQVLGMGFGRAPEDQLDRHVGGIAFQHSISVVAKALGLRLDDIEVVRETANALESFRLPGGTPIEKGTIAAERVTMAGIVDGKPTIRFRLNWYCTTAIDKDWKLRGNGWRLVIEGETPIEANISFPVSPERLSPVMSGLSAYRVINAVPYVCAADPGIRTSAELPGIVPNLAAAIHEAGAVE